MLAGDAATALPRGSQGDAVLRRGSERHSEAERAERRENGEFHLRCVPDVSEDGLSAGSSLRVHAGEERKW